MENNEYFFSINVYDPGSAYIYYFRVYKKKNSKINILPYILNNDYFFFISYYKLNVRILNQISHNVYEEMLMLSIT